MTVLQSGLVLATGGTISSFATAFPTADLYDPSTNSWASIGSMSSNRYLHTATLFPIGDVLVAGGKTPTSTPNSIELFNTAGGSWTTIPGAIIPRWSHTATLVNTVVLLVGGYSSTGTPLASIDVCDVSGSCTTVVALSTARSYHTATRLNNGKVLVAGGEDGSTVLQSAELIDASGSSTPASSMAFPHSRHVAALLPNGNVIVIAGLDGSFTSSNHVELYNPATNTWSTTSSTSNNYGGDFDGTLLSSGNVFIYGGSCPTPCQPEIYNVVAGTWSSGAVAGYSRTQGRVALLGSGRVLVASGYDGSSATDVTAAEEYCP